jgi:hypothetical protein
MHVLCCTTTYNRDTCLQRLLRSYLEQDYQGKSTLLVFNSGVETSFPEFDLPENKEIILVNRVTDEVTGKPYASVGDKYRDSLLNLEGIDVWTSSDVDDIFLPNHISKGVEGMQKAYQIGMLAYKPKKSYYMSGGKIYRNENVYEPSIFIDFSHIKEHGFHSNSVKYHDKWLLPLVMNNKIFSDPQGESTFCYDWGGIPVYKMSGKGEDTPQNFLNSQKKERDFGSGITNPSDKESYYKLIDYIKTSFRE